MLFADHLSKDTIRKFNQLKRDPPKDEPVKVKRNEQLSDRDLRELMGVNRDTYKRKHGAIRRK